MPIPAPRFYFLLVLGLVSALALADLLGPGRSAVITLAADGGLLLLALIDGQLARVRRVQVERTLIPKLSVGRDNPIELTVTAGKHGAPLRLRDAYPPQFTVSQSVLTVAIAPQRQQTLSYTIHPDQRGQFDWGDVQVRQLGPLGLAWHDWTVPAAQTVAVYPDLMGLRSLAVRLAVQNSGALRQSRRLGQGTEFAELREYRVGDDTRLIDWKATARRSKPLVRVLEPEREQTLIILLDRGRLMTARVQGLLRFDWGLNAALALALAGLHRGDRVGIGVFDRELSLWLPPERGAYRFNRLLERLTPLQPALLEPDYFGAVTQVAEQQPRRALVVVLTDVVDRTASAELLAALMRLSPRYLPFCVTLRDPQVDAIARPPEPQDESTPAPRRELAAAYQRAVALDLLAQRAIAFAELKRQGVLVLDAPADRISTQLVDRYLQLKARSLL
ncbi:MAG: DUF58 domain-containing protein [Spirulinaceae cyanobacterium SM2_1_0]|nr:DUF58 domain-containing protein [Spirulinaceae cyanobacterium SM2_1_0]